MYSLKDQDRKWIRYVTTSTPLLITCMLNSLQVNIKIDKMHIRITGLYKVLLETIGVTLVLHYCVWRQVEYSLQRVSDPRSRDRVTGSAIP